MLQAVVDRMRPASLAYISPLSSRNRPVNRYPAKSGPISAVTSAICNRDGSLVAFIVHDSSSASFSRQMAAPLRRSPINVPTGLSPTSVISLLSSPKTTTQTNMQVVRWNEPKIKHKQFFGFQAKRTCAIGKTPHVILEGLWSAVRHRLQLKRAETV